MDNLIDVGLSKTPHKYSSWSVVIGAYALGFLTACLLGLFGRQISSPQGGPTWSRPVKHPGSQADLKPATFAPKASPGEDPIR